MKTYKVESLKIDKRYKSVLIDAESRKAAIAMARDMRDEDFDETETAQATEWKTKKIWRFWDLFMKSTKEGENIC